MLEEYARKRNFSRTAEPAPRRAAKTRTAENGSFCVQRHDARRLHYDLRLEVDGVLKSWAVPKGPSMDPSVRRLAAHVEDHPLEYGGFEGSIAEGEYGAGSVMLWDRGRYELLEAEVPAEEQLERGDFKFRLAGEKLRGDFALVKMKGRGKDEWLLIKKRDAFAEPGWEVEDYAWSVISGRTQEQIARNLPAKKKRQGRGVGRDCATAAAAVAARPKRQERGKRNNAGDNSGGFDPKALEGTRAAKMPGWFEPMRATIAQRPPVGEDWLFEVKWDGVRALCFVDEGEVRIYSRNGRRCEKQYPELGVLPYALKARQAIVDGEIAVLDGEGVSRFALIQPRIANSDAATVARLARKTPVVLYLFDLLYLNGYDLRGVKLAERRRALEAVVTPSEVVRISKAWRGQGEELLAAAREKGLEGILAKHAASLYEPRRSRQWQKLKLVNEEEFLIGGFTHGKGHAQLGALVLGMYEKGRLMWVGNAGTGFTAQSAREVMQRLEALRTKRSPFAAGQKVAARGASWVTPELVAMVKFSNWTAGKHLRAPVFLGLRDDVRPAEVRGEAAGPLLRGAQESAAVEIDGRQLRFTHLNKEMFPGDHYTKRDLLNYYDAVAELILPHLKDRPLSLKRYPNGIAAPYFFQKNMPANQGPWLRRVAIRSEHGTDATHAVLAEDRASLLYLVHLGCIDQNPWMSRVGTLDHPDFVLVDLDPHECGYDTVVEAALLVREVLQSIGMEGYPKTTGGEGMHIYVPLEPVYGYDDSRALAELLARLAMAERPELFTTERSVAQREKGRVYFDTLQNGKSKTIASPYSVRAHPHAPVSTPLRWDEVRRGLRPEQFTIRNAPDRFAEMGDLFEAVLRRPQKIEGALKRLETQLRAS